jgi:hypothetical protein
MLLFGLGLGLIIGASGEQPPMTLVLSLIWTAAFPLIFIGYSIRKTFQKIEL